MNLPDLLSVDCIKVPLESVDKRGAIEELIDLLVAAGKVTDGDALKEAVWTRETTRTTGIGHALAIPHGKSEGVTDLSMAIGKPEEPIDFNSIDNKPVRLIVLLASPIDRTTDHIQALARISRLMTVEAFRKQVYAASSAQEILDLIRAREQETAGVSSGS